MIQLLLAIFEAFPIIDKWATLIMVEYAKQQKEKGNAAFTGAMGKALADNTEDLQSSLGSNLK